MRKNIAPANSSISRRDFLAGSLAGSAAIGAGLTAPALGADYFVQGSDQIRVGLIGCGGRGTGAALNALAADDATQLWAMGDLFPDRLADADKVLIARAGERYQVAEERKFTGFDAYRSVLGEEVDFVILTTPPYFRPFHFAAAVRAGKHVFFEKPVAVDPAGVRQVLAAGREAKEKGLGVVVGTQRRHDTNYLEAMKAIHDGEIGEVVGADVYWCQGGLWHMGRPEEWTDVEFQLRNWLYFTWLSGDQICEQHIHNLDVALWAFGDEAPERVIASGGRDVRTDPLYGNVYDHMDATFTMPGGRKITSKCRQFPGAPANLVGEEIFGTRGRAMLNQVRNGCHLLNYKGSVLRSFNTDNNSLVAEHRSLLNSIREGLPVNDAERIAGTNLAAIIGRESAYSGDQVRYKWALDESTLRLGPADCDELCFGPMPIDAVCLPGSYKLA